MNPEFGKRRVHVTPEALGGVLVSGGLVETDLPDDARLVDIWRPRTGDEHNTFTFIFESSEWEAPSEGERIPLHEVKVEWGKLTFRIEG